MAGVIYLLGNDDDLVELRESAYDSEDLLQTLLAKYPSLLAGDQINDAEPRRWLLISREAGLPSQEESGARWSVDHLFLDQDGIPTIVEVKRSSDTRIRREVVGQMLDYAANAVMYWPIESIQAMFETRCEKEGINANNKLAEFLDNVTQSDSFWQQVKTNLQAGKIRLIFVADEISVELRRIVEFLNGQMDPAEVIALEVKQFTGKDIKTLVPRALNRTTEKHKDISTKRKWDEPTFLTELESRQGKTEANVAKDLLEWAKSNSLRIWWGEGRQDGSFYPLLDHASDTYWTFAVWTYGRISIQFYMMKKKPLFADDSKRESIRLRLNNIPGVSISENDISRFPGINLSILTKPDALKQFKEIFQEIINEIRTNN
jgi:hypothetical protein